MPCTDPRTAEDLHFSLSWPFAAFLPLVMRVCVARCSVVCSEKMAAPGKKSFFVFEYHASKSVATEQRAFRSKYAKDPPTDKTIRA